jgi:hypothetical protein
VRSLYKRAVIRTESFSRRVKEIWDKRSGAEELCIDRCPLTGELSQNAFHFMPLA